MFITLQLLFSFLGGGLVVGLLNLWHTTRSQQKARRAEFLRLQLHQLYGSLQFFGSCNRSIFEIQVKINDALKAKYDGKEHPALEERVEQVIDLKNEYSAQIHANNKRMIEILTTHYSLIEPSDADVFADFIGNYTRHCTEYEEAGRLKLPLEIYTQVGHVYPLREEFLECINKRFHEKRAELEELMR